MTTQDSAAVSQPPVPAQPSWAWLRAALTQPGGAQLITIAVSSSADSVAETWSSLLLASALAPLAAAFAPAPVSRLAAAVGVLVPAAGIGGGIGRTGRFFIPALVVGRRRGEALARAVLTRGRCSG